MCVKRWRGAAESAGYAQPKVEQEREQRQVDHNVVRLDGPVQAGEHALDHTAEVAKLVHTVRDNDCGWAVGGGSNGRLPSHKRQDTGLARYTEIILLLAAPLDAPVMVERVAGAIVEEDFLTRNGEECANVLAEDLNARHIRVVPVPNGATRPKEI